MVDDVVGKECHCQENQGAGKHRDKDERETRMTLYPDQGSRPAGRMDGAGKLVIFPPLPMFLLKRKQGPSASPIPLLLTPP